MPIRGASSVGAAAKPGAGGAAGAAARALLPPTMAMAGRASALQAPHVTEMGDGVPCGRCGQCVGGGRSEFMVGCGRAGAFTNTG